MKSLEQISKFLTMNEAFPTIRKVEKKRDEGKRSGKKKKWAGSKKLESR
jgi:hypothetical protein